MNVTIYYVETGRGCGLRVAKSADAAGKAALREVGTLDGIKCVRKATERDIAWVRGMGGHVPKGRAARTTGEN